jgi:hypothetical protein
MAADDIILDADKIDASTKSIEEQTIAVKNLTLEQRNSAEGIRIISNLTSSYKDMVNGATTSLSKFSSISSFAGEALKGIGDKATKLIGNLKDMNSMSDVGVAKFGALSVAMLGAKDSFNSFSNVDTSGLSLFKDQFAGLMQVMQNSPGAQASLDIINKVKNALVATGKVSEQSLASMGGKAIMGAAEQMVVSADNALKLQNAYLQLSASSGNFSNVTKMAGEDLSKLNNVLAAQGDYLTNNAQNNNVNTAQMTKFWEQLSPTLSNLDNMNVLLAGSSKHMDTLTAATRIATGSGRSQKDVFDDINKATIEYGMNISNAVTFTSRIGEIASKVKAPMNEVRSALMASADSFKYFVDAGESAARQSEGQAKMMATYVEALKGTGLTAAASVPLVSTMTSSIKELNVAQRAFLSSQSGGPGGLRGAAQIEKMLRDGKDQEVMNMMLKQIKSQTGSVVSIDDASKSEGAAAQRQKQMLMLQQGPMGKLADSPEKAARLLEALGNMDKGKVSKVNLSDTIAQDTASKGQQIQGLSKTPIGDIVNAFDGLRVTADIANLSTLQKTMTSTAGVNLANDTIDQKDMRAGLKRDKLTDMNRDTGSLAASNLNNVIDKTQSTAKSLPVMATGFKNSFMEQGESIAKQKEQAREQFKNASKSRFGTTGLSSTDENSFGEASAPNMVKTAIQTGMPRQGVAQAQAAQFTNNNDTNKEMNVNLNVSAICTVCQHTIETSEQASSVNTHVHQPPTKK